MENENSYYSQPLFVEDDSIDVKRYFSLFISNWYWFAIALFISFTVAYGFNRYSAEIYNVSASLLIKDETLTGFTAMTPIFPGTEAFKNQQNLKNEIGVLKSYELNRKVIDSLPEFHVTYTLIGRRRIVENRRYRTLPFIVIPDSCCRIAPPDYSISIQPLDTGGFRIQIRGSKGEWEYMNFGDTVTPARLGIENGDPFSFIVQLRNPDVPGYDPEISNNYYFRFADLSALANQYRSKLQVNPIDEGATLVTLSVTGEVAEQEIDYLNKLIHLYIDRGLEIKNKTAELTIQFIDNQLDTIRRELGSFEDSLVKFRNDNRIIDISSEAAAVKSRLERYDAERISLSLQRQYFEYLTGYITSRNETGDIVAPSVMGINDPILERLISELSALQKHKSQLLLNLSADLPVIAMANDNIEKTRRALSDNIASSLSNINSSLDDVGKRIVTAEKGLTRLPDVEKNLVSIQRGYDLSNTVYTYLLEKKAEAEIAKASNVPDNMPVDMAGLHSVVQTRPRTARNNFMALVLGIIIPMMLILLIDWLNNRVIDKKDIEKSTSVPVIGFISHNDYKTEIPVVSKPLSTLAESFRSVRTSLRFLVPEHEKAIIAVSSTVSAEGKTFVSVNLASITATLGKRVLLIGLDLRKPKIHRILETDNSTGMSSYLSGNATFAEVVRETSVPNLSYAPAGPIPPNPAELIDSHRMGEFLQEAREQFDFIIIDTPPVAIVTDALLLARYVDVNLFVVRQRYTSKNTLSLIQDLHTGKKLRNLSIIINDISLTGYYGYGLRYGYTMKYGGYSYGYSLYGDYVYSRYGYRKESEGYYAEDSDS